MATPRFTLGGANGWPIKEGSVLAYENTNGLFKPAPFDVARNSGGSYVDANGLIQQEYRPNVPRITYSGGRACLMNETARTNLIPYSNAFDNTASGGEWANNQVTVTSDSGASPFLDENADLITEDSDVGQVHRLLDSSISVSNATEYTYSFYVKANGRNFVILRSGITGSSINNSFNISAGSVLSSGAGFTCSIEDVGSGWYRCIATATSAVTTTEFQVVLSDDGTNLSYNGDGTSGVYLIGAQLEAGSYVSSVIPTEGAAATRAAETIESLNLGNFLGDSEGGLYADVAAFDTGDFNAISLSDGTTSNRAFFNLAADSMFFNFVASGVTEVNYQGSAIIDNTFYKVFFGYAPNDYAAYLDGAQETTDTSLSTFAADTLTEVKADSGAGGSDFRGLIYEIQVFDTRPTNAEMEAQTT